MTYPQQSERNDLKENIADMLGQLIDGYCKYTPIGDELPATSRMEFLMALAHECRNKNKYQAAIELYDEAISVDNLNEFAFASMSLAHNHLDNFAQVQSYLSQSATLHRLLGDGSRTAIYQQVLIFLNKIKLLRPVENWEAQFAIKYPQIKIFDDDGAFSQQFIENLKCELIIHRGSLSEELENSFEGVKQILSVNSAVRIEVDVAMTRDEVLVLNHDATLLRLVGANIPVIGASYEEIRSVFPIPKLTELLDTFPDQKFVLDIKHDFEIENSSDSQWVQSSSIFAPERIIPPLVETLYERSPELLRLTAFSSEFHQLLEDHLPNIECALTDSKRMAAYKSFIHSEDPNCLAGLPAWLLTDGPTLDAQLAQKLKENGCKIYSGPSTLPLREQIIQAAVLDLDAVMISFMSGNIAELILEPWRRYIN